MPLHVAAPWLSAASPWGLLSAEGRATVPGPPSPGPPSPRVTFPRPPWGSPQTRGQVAMPPAPHDAGWEDGDEDNQDKDTPRSPRDAEHTGGEAPGTPPAQGLLPGFVA